MITLTNQALWFTDSKKAKWALEILEKFITLTKLITLTMITLSGLHRTKDF